MESHEAAALTSEGEAFGTLSLNVALPSRGWQSHCCSEGSPLSMPAGWALELYPNRVHGFYEPLNVSVGTIGAGHDAWVRPRVLVPANRPL
jgi:hypothetical protein